MEAEEEEVAGAQEAEEVAGAQEAATRVMGAVAGDTAAGAGLERRGF